MNRAAWIALLASALTLCTGAVSARAENRLFVAAGDGSDNIGPFKGPATDAGVFGLQDIAVSPDGSFLISLAGRGNTVVRVDRKGWIRRVAGGPREGFSGDGGPATRARLRSSFDIAATADGGFLIADQGNCRVRRVGPNGTINTVAGSGPANCQPASETDSPGPAPDDGGPATAARVNPRAVAALRDGGFLLSEGNRVRRVYPDGTIITVAGTGAGDSTRPTVGGKPATATELFTPGTLAETPDGGFLVRDGFQAVQQVRPDGVLVPTGASGLLSDAGAVYTAGSEGSGLFGPFPARDTLISQRPSDYFGGWGEPATGAPSWQLLDVEPTLDGGLLLATDDAYGQAARVIFSAPPGTGRLAVAVASESLPALLRRRLRFRLTRAARVKVRIYRGRRVAARLTVSGKQGLNTVRLPRRRIKRGLRYVRLRALSSGAVATNGLRVLVGAWLPKRVAHGSITTDVSCVGECGGVEERIGPCRRFGPRRVDCVVGSEDLDTEERTPCTEVVSAVLRRSGYLYLRPYRCRKSKRVGYFRSRTRYSSRAHQAPPL